MKKTAEEWALLNGYKVDQWIGDGDFGEAYLTTCGKILKVTSDKEEFVAASRIEGLQDDYLIEIYKTDAYDNDLVILMECLDTANVEDLFNEIITATGEDGIEALEFGDAEDYDLSDEASLLFSDLQSCISSYQVNGTNPMDIHENNIGINSKGHYVLFDQKDKIADLSEELEKILEEKEKQKLLNQLKSPRIELGYEIKELDYKSTDFNDKMRHLMTEVINKISQEKKYLSPRHNKDTHPELLFPEKVGVDIYFTTDPEIFLNFNIHNDDGYGVLGFQAITTGDGLLGESEYMDNHACIIVIDEKKYNEYKENNFLNERAFLKSYLTTITHELNHIFEFIENSGGLSPRVLDSVHECDDFEFNHFDCMTGYNILPMFDSGELDPDDALDIMEERVELKGVKLLNKLDIDNGIELFLSSTNKQKKKPKLR